MITGTHLKKKKEREKKEKEIFLKFQHPSKLFSTCQALSTSKPIIPLQPESRLSRKKKVSLIRVADEYLLQFTKLFQSRLCQVYGSPFSHHLWV